MVSASQGYNAACYALHGKDDASCAECCTPTHQHVREAALAQGLDSLQSCCGARGSNPNVHFFEMVFFGPACRAEGLGACPQPEELEMRRTLAGGHAGRCECAAAHGYTTCSARLADATPDMPSPMQLEWKDREHGEGIGGRVQDDGVMMAPHVVRIGIDERGSQRGSLPGYSL